ncbi:MAG: hypothetical protein H7Y22_01445 [Gemmatimonadaceae bacterium]|nr:hypothetical protein [Gloeobacterales cyanobacterium ES-bin-141]
MRAILFVEPLGGIGDVVIALGAIQALGRSHNRARLTVLTFAPGGELLEGDPLIHEVIYAERAAPLQAFVELLARRQFDLIVSDTCYEDIDRLISDQDRTCVVTNLWRTPPPDERVGERFIRILLSEGWITPEAIASPRLTLSTTERRGARTFSDVTRKPPVRLPFYVQM